MSWSTAIAEVFATINKAFDRYLGSQTREMDKLEAKAEHAATQKRQALDAHPPDLAAANRWDRELQRVYHEIAAKRG